MTSKTPVLDLDVELQRIEVTFKGKPYEVRARGELSILEARKLSSLIRENHEAVLALDSDDEAAADEAGETISKTLQSVAALLVVDPPEGGFPDQTCAAILNFWTDNQPDADPPKPPRAAPRDRQPKKSRTGAKSSRAS